MSQPQRAYAWVRNHHTILFFEDHGPHTWAQVMPRGNEAVVCLLCGAKATALKNPYRLMPPATSSTRAAARQVWLRGVAR